VEAIAAVSKEETFSSIAGSSGHEERLWLAEGAASGS
jgi:hypothetical protein